MDETDVEDSEQDLSFVVLLVAALFIGCLLEGELTKTLNKQLSGDVYGQQSAEISKKKD
jgi:hypothetical protein